MQRICTPSRPARSISAMVLAMFASRMVSSFSDVEQAWVAWINPHLTTRGISSFPGFLKTVHHGNTEEHTEDTLEGKQHTHIVPASSSVSTPSLPCFRG